MKSLNSALCHDCGKGQIYYVEAKKCNRCYQRKWAREKYQQNKEEMREKSKLSSRERKRKLGKRLPKIDNLWSGKYDFCVKCGNNQHKHAGKGLCTICHDRKRYPEKHKKYLKKLYSDEKFHEKEKERYRKHGKKQYENAEMREKSKIRARNYYKKNRVKMRNYNNQQYHKKMNQLKEKIGKVKCDECNEKFQPVIFTKKQKFCSNKCSKNKWYKTNEEILKAKDRINRILNNKRICERAQELASRRKIKKKEQDINYYVNNYPKLRKTSRTREILNGKCIGMNGKDFEEIVKRDIIILKEKIMQKEIELKNINQQKPLINFIK